MKITVHLRKGSLEFLVTKEKKTGYEGWEAQIRSIGLRDKN